MKKIYFSTNKWTDDEYFTVPDDKYEEMNAKKWYVMTNGRKDSFCAARTATKKERAAGSSTAINAHRQVLGIHLRKPFKNETVDHLDRNRFNNTYENLEIKTTHGNLRNAKSNTNIGVGLWGVSFRVDLRSKPWQAGFT